MSVDWFKWRRHEQEFDDLPRITGGPLPTPEEVALYQFDNHMIPDYCNTGGVLYLDEDGEWVDYDAEDWGAA